jgi:hypothetical protein
MHRHMKKECHLDCQHCHSAIVKGISGDVNGNRSGNVYVTLTSRKKNVAMLLLTFILTTFHLTTLLLSLCSSSNSHCNLFNSKLIVGRSNESSSFDPWVLPFLAANAQSSTTWAWIGTSPFFHDS